MCVSRGGRNKEKLEGYLSIIMKNITSMTALLTALLEHFDCVLTVNDITIHDFWECSVTNSLTMQLISAWHSTLAISTPSSLP